MWIDIGLQSNLNLNRILSLWPLLKYTNFTKILYKILVFKFDNRSIQQVEWQYHNNKYNIIIILVYHDKSLFLNVQSK